MTEPEEIDVPEAGSGPTAECVRAVTEALENNDADKVRGLVADLVRVEVPGGILTVEMDGTIWLGGPVSFVGDVEAVVGEGPA